MTQQAVHAVAAALTSFPLDCHLTLFWEQTDHSASRLTSATEGLRKEVWASHRPVQVSEDDYTSTT